MAESESKYKDTISLPQTDFPMRGNLPTTEPLTIERWRKNSIYQKMTAKNKAADKFVMPDGPPYANGGIHIGHTLNKVLKDIVIKFRNMQGYRAEFIPGWDCHGLPIELKVTKNLGDKRKTLTKKDIRELCRKEASKWIDVQRDQFIRLGVIADWQNPYLTMSPDYEANEIRVLAQIQRNGVLFRGEKPVYWCPALQTALAAAEVEYHDHKSPSVYVKFAVEKPSGPLAGLNKPVSMVIWTTTPWTLPANYAIALHPNFDYGFYDTGAEILVIAKELAESFSKETGIVLGQSAKTVKGAALERQVARHPFMNRDSLVILGDHVTLETGTGAVHTAPGHGLEDYHVGLKYDLPVHSPVDPAGRFTADVPQYVGLKIWDANKKIVEDLKASGHLLGYKEISHSYPHNPRSKTPLIFRSTPQWFIRMDDDYGLRRRALAAAEKEIKFFPQWGKARLVAMIENTPDWCVSRQRIWGVPIPVFYCAKCGTSLARPEIMERVADKMESTGTGIEAYHDLPAKEFIGDEKCGNCGHGEFNKSEDILDVWFDSGVCHTSVQKTRDGLAFPADIYLEGSDQHRGWFQTSLISSIAAYGEPPFRALITHGFVNDAQGHKMSKSKGNVVDPAEVIKKYGAEILRLWVAYEDYGTDVSVSEEMFQRVTETYRRIRNTMRFLLGNLGDFDPKAHRVPVEKMPPLDRWALARLNDVIEKTTKSYESYDFFKIYHSLNTFFTVDLSATYLDVLKDRLYTGKKDGLPRRSSQTVFYEMLHVLTGLMAPVLSFLAEEVYGYIPGEKQESVFLTPFPKPRAEWRNDALVARLETLGEVREKLSRRLEELRREKTIGSSLDAEALITVDGKVFDTLKELEPHLREYFIVSNVVLNRGAEVIDAAKAPGERCERCWHYSPQTGKNPRFPGLDQKCVEALS